MKLQKIVLLGMSALMLSGCSFFGGNSGDSSSESSGTKYPVSLCDNLPEKCKFVVDITHTTITKVGHNYMTFDLGGTYVYYQIQKSGNYQAWYKMSGETSWSKYNNKNQESEDKVAEALGFDFMLSAYDSTSNFATAPFDIEKTASVNNDIAEADRKEGESSTTLKVDSYVSSATGEEFQIREIGGIKVCMMYQRMEGTTIKESKFVFSYYTNVTGFDTGTPTSLF